MFLSSAAPPKKTRGRGKGRGEAREEAKAAEGKAVQAPAPALHTMTHLPEVVVALAMRTRRSATKA